MWELAQLKLFEHVFVDSQYEKKYIIARSSGSFATSLHSSSSFRSSSLEVINLRFREKRRKLLNNNSKHENDSNLKNRETVHVRSTKCSSADDVDSLLMRDKRVASNKTTSELEELQLHTILSFVIIFLGWEFCFFRSIENYCTLRLAMIIVVENWELHTAIVFVRQSYLNS